MRKLLFAFTILTAFVASTLAQDRQVELSATIPVKRALLSQEIVLGGRVYLPVNDRLVTVADLSFRDAAQLFLTPTDQISVDGEAWVFLTGSENKTRPFAFGGIAQSFFVGAPVEGINSTQAKSGFGIVFKKASGFTAIPIFTFSTDDLQADRTVLGKAFAFETRLFVPLGSNFNLNLAPFVAREELPTGALYTTKYGIKLGFARKF
jgi:hypothetical protein